MALKELNCKEVIDVSGGLLSSVYSKINKLLNATALIIVLIWSPVYGYYSVKAAAINKQGLQRVFVIENNFHYKFINPFIGDALGFSPFALTIAFVSKENIENSEVELEGVIRHEAKHIEQKQTLGFFEYLFMDEWKIEGIAEYARGSSTIPLCDFDSTDLSIRKNYREYHLVAKYLIEHIGLSESDIYSFEQYPIQEASDWVLLEICS